MVGSPDVPAAPRDLALAALAADDWPRASALLTRLLADDDDPELRLHLGVALWCQYDIDAALEQLKRAYREFLASGRPGRASWVACWIAWEEAAIHGNPSIAQGWFGRAGSLLDGMASSPESAWLRVWQAAFDGDPVVLVEASRSGVEAARSAGDRELEMLSLAEHGLALVGLGRVQDGMAALDQSMAGVLAGEARLPVVISDCFCAMLAACEQVGDLARAQEWCEAAQRTADARAIRFLGASCHVTYGSILASTGRYGEAEQAIEAAMRMFSGGHRQLRLDAIARLADIRRRQGRLAEARALVADAHGMGSALRVGAEIHLAERQPELAREVARRLASRAGSTAERAAARALLVRASAACGDATAAEAELAELELLAPAISTPTIAGALWLARGAAAAVAGRHTEALDAYREARDVFAAAGMVAELEDAVRQLDQLDATRPRTVPDEAALQQDVHDAGRGSAARPRAAASHEDVEELALGPRLSPRELEVLSHLAAGHSNAAIARQLVVSEHTVHRHVANLLRKLDAPTRAAAVATASRRGLL